jgi:hypothetical protein
VKPGVNEDGVAQTKLDHLGNCRPISKLLLLPGADDTERFLVRERDDDYEGDHNKGDHISIKPFPIDVDSHLNSTPLSGSSQENKP